jgi:hypothetical protein
MNAIDSAQLGEWPLMIVYTKIEMASVRCS